LVIAYFIFTAVTNFKAGKLVRENPTQDGNSKIRP
jgi:hypothetical protein